MLNLITAAKFVTLGGDQVAIGKDSLSQNQYCASDTLQP